MDFVSKVQKHLTVRIPFAKTVEGGGVVKDVIVVRIVLVVVVGCNVDVLV